MKRKNLNAIFWILYSLVSTTWVIDYMNVRIENEPLFCLSITETNYEDGKVTTCNGLGYRIRNYNRESLTKGFTFEHYFKKEVNYEN